MSHKRGKKHSGFSARTFWLVFCVFILLCSLALFISQVLAYVRAKRDVQSHKQAPSVVMATAAPAPSASPVPSPAVTPEITPTPSPAPDPEAVNTALTVSSTEEDLYIVIRGDDGAAIEGVGFLLDVTFPDGNTYTYDCDPDGSCYLVSLSPGEYTVALRQHPGFNVPEAVQCTVKAPVEHVAIRNIDDVAEVTFEAAVADEIKTGSDYAEQVETITTEEEIAESGASAEEVAVLDANGNPTYTYTYGLDENGCLYYNGTEKSSGVILVQEEQGGEVYGLRQVQPEPIENGDGTVTEILPYFETVQLIYPDNTPNPDYAITAVPVTRPAQMNVGWQIIGGETYYFNAAGEKLTGLKEIDGQLYFFGEDGRKASRLGIDVSAYNGSVNWTAVKQQGIDFAIVRIGGRGWTSGVLYDDTFSYEYLHAAREVGIDVGVYFYSTAVDTEEAVQEASLAIQRLGGMALDLPIYFDTEYSGEFPEGRSDLLSIPQRTEIARAFCETVENSGYTAGVYSGLNFYMNNIDYGSVSGYSVWMANYTKDYREPAFPWRYDIWQFTSTGMVRGISGGVDMNVMF